jgi:hypothetical protein
VRQVSNDAVVHVRVYIDPLANSYFTFLSALVSYLNTFRGLNSLTLDMFGFGRKRANMGGGGMTTTRPEHHYGFQYVASLFNREILEPYS